MDEVLEFYKYRVGDWRERGSSTVAEDLLGMPVVQLVRDRYANHSASFDHLRVSTFPLTAIPTACFWPTTTTSFLPRVMPV